MIVSKGVREAQCFVSDAITTDATDEQLRCGPVDTQHRLTFGSIKIVLMENKEFILAPAFALIPQLFLLPFFIAAFPMRCQDFQIMNIRYLLIVSYFMGFIPSFTSFYLYISPSSFYREKWQQTQLAKRLRDVTQRYPMFAFINKFTLTDKHVM